LVRQGEYFIEKFRHKLPKLTEIFDAKDAEWQVGKEKLGEILAPSFSGLATLKNLPMPVVRKRLWGHYFDGIGAKEISA
jgi:hypothetical protein